MVFVGFSMIFRCLNVLGALKSLKSDEKATMKLITDIHTQLRTANALKLSYSALTKKSGS